MKTTVEKVNLVVHKADTRGDANHGWLHSRHTFSFAAYHNPERMNFGTLRVLNDDIVAESRGFGTHPHRDMEIISIPLEGDLKHEDNMGNKTIIKSGDVQVMSAGTGIMHSEYNANEDEKVKFLQIWVFPNKKGVTPRYDQITLNTEDRKNKLQQVLSPNPEDEGVWVHQNAWFHMTNLEKGKTVEYTLKDPENNGLYAFIIKGDVTIAGESLNQRDGIGINNATEISLVADSDTEVLLMEVPMNINA
ncbi:pirin family protein [Aquimarina sp. U1-2]|uniref:pirin family protein n=1 Tax=Aquimarina sp. U1-2 TaxID=2823141 RepID=UPI001AEC966F|nr:pirin family protein [Aquimarina sp. U1-2]MBP2831821.1 pirin family protein [Aquimarina sp. U1-2]